MDKPWSVPASLTPSQDFSPPWGEERGAYPQGFPQGAGVGFFLGSEKDFEVGKSPMDFMVPMGGAYCFPETQVLKGEERLGPVQISLLAKHLGV